ncbi:chemotaxis-specific protein-glutamate methyltransferase CheB [Salinilacihabitans rarus]|uniref:chemotaxis-specific protein-glutamate methyltransferase CheB n=1 Tax=Salinilacihabitans rarus TaxID=2961596 RepID=UPI0020C906F1|nr:chemotaxis-specific protein-glutamate methyltransferase CheB [Salinilacihabitans rarus]
MTRVLVVDDSRFIRRVVDDALTNAGYDVVTAADGATAVEAVDEHDPDVVTMDVEMPGMSGIEAVARIMSAAPTPVLMLSADTADGAEATLDALERGAVDFLPKANTDGRDIDDFAAAVVEKVDDLAAASISSLALARTTAAAHAAGVAAETADRRGVAGTVAREGDAETVALDGEPSGDPTVVVGASTGGPRIVERLVATLPADLGAKLLVVQHMPSEFTARFAERLDAISEYEVREARDGDRIGPGEALVARGGYHLAVRNNVGGRVRVGLEDGERIHGVRPAIDVTMRTAAERVSDPLCGVVLSGMGRDGAAGIEAVKEAGGRTIAQDERTSPVFGIPAKAIETGRVDEVVPAEGVAESIVDAFDTEGER